MTEERAVEMVLNEWSKCKTQKRQIHSGLCSKCGDLFFTIASYGQMTCSRECSKKLFSGKNSYHWKGGIHRMISKAHGYVVLDLRDDGIRITEHRYVMEKYLGRPLRPFESVHHKNGIRTDNRIENLELWARPQLPGQRVADLLQWCLDGYEKELRIKIDVLDAIKKLPSVDVDFKELSSV